MSDDGIRSPSRQWIRREEFVVMQLDPQDLLDQPELDISDEQIQRIVESVYPIIDEYWRNAELIAQRCFIEPSNAFDVARADAERELFAAVAPDDPKLEGCRW